MDETAWLSERFEEHRGHLRAVAYRMLGSFSDADDPSLVRTIDRAMRAADKLGATRVGCEHLLIGLTLEDSPLADLLRGRAARCNNLVRRYQDLTGRDVVDRTALLQLVP
jgi:hypothetical protein